MACYPRTIKKRPETQCRQKIPTMLSSESEAPGPATSTPYVPDPDDPTRQPTLPIGKR